MRTVVSCVAVALVLVVACDTRAGEDLWSAHDGATKELRGQEAELRVMNGAIEACREALAAGKSGDLAAARKAVDEAEQAVTAAGAGSDVAAAREKMQQTRATRDKKIESLLADAPTYRAAVDRRAELQKRVGELESRLATLTEADLLELSRLRVEVQHLNKRLYGATRAWWKRGEVEAEYKAADEAYKAYNALAGKSKALADATQKAKAARKALESAIDALPLESEVAKALVARRTAIETKVTEIKAKLAELEKTLIGSAKTVTVGFKGMDRKTRQETEKKISLWMPNTDYIRGVIMAHPMIGGLATGHETRLAAARAGLATVVFEDYSLEHIDALLEKFAAESKHPELRGAPLMVGGLSASVLATRNLACAYPQRVFGVVHAAGGNMQEMPDDGRGMKEVPFLAMNGEFEWCGPVGGIRPEYGNQTQWLMIREQMLRLWRNKQEHRMALVVVPNADHGAWDRNLTALFIRKAAEYRLPKEKRDGSAPAVCTPLPVNKGWLTDADLDHPKFEPAGYDAFKGDKNNAFWHFDEEMARAVYEYHKGKFILPDPTKSKPVPADWPGKGK